MTDLESRVALALANHAQQAPDGQQLLLAVTRRRIADQRRRRRSAVLGALVAVVAVVAVAGSAFAVLRPSSGQHSPDPIAGQGAPGLLPIIPAGMQAAFAGCRCSFQRSGP